MITLCSFARVRLSMTGSFYNQNGPSIIMRSFLHGGHGGVQNGGGVQNYGGVQNGGSCWRQGCMLRTLSGLSSRRGLLHSAMHFKQLHCGVISHSNASSMLLLPQRTCLFSWRFNSSDIPLGTLPQKVGKAVSCTLEEFLCLIWF